MSGKQYSSYEEIDRDLQILNLEKEIHFKKLAQSFDRTKESLSPAHLLGSVPKLALNALGSVSGPIKNIGIAFLLKKIFKFF